MLDRSCTDKTDKKYTETKKVKNCFMFFYLFLAFVQPQTMTSEGYEQEEMQSWDSMVSRYLEKFSNFITFSSVVGLNSVRVVFRWNSFGAKERSAIDTVSQQRYLPEV